MDAPEGWIALLRQVGDVEERLAEADPDIAVALLGVKHGRARVWDGLLERELRDVHELTVTVIFPAVIAADDVAVLDPALRQLCCAMAAAVLERGRLAIFRKKEDEVLAEQPERLRAVLPSFSLSAQA